MASTQVDPSAPLPPTPLPYQRELVQLLKSEEPALWQWFASAQARPEQAEAVRLELLKSTYRLEPASQPPLQAFAEEVLAAYGLKVPITFYQAQTGGGMNAALAYVPGEIHLVLTGPVATVLSEAELKALLGHELAHYLLFQEWGGEFLVATDLLRSLSNDAGAAPAHLESARLFNLYAEVFADRGAFFITGDAQAAVSTLIKMETGLTEVSADSYLRQAEEIFCKSQVQANQLTHPEPYIRARALWLWSRQGEEALAEIEKIIEGRLALERLDLLGQRKIAATTRRLLRCLLDASWFQSEAVLGHARLFFDDFVPDNQAGEEQALAGEVQNSDPSLQDYYCYVLLDFASVDADLGEVALARALLLSQTLGLGDRFTEVAMKELGLAKKQFTKMAREAAELVARANETSRQA